MSSINITPNNNYKISMRANNITSNFGDNFTLPPGPETAAMPPASSQYDSDAGSLQISVTSGTAAFEIMTPTPAWSGTAFAKVIALGGQNLNTANISANFFYTVNGGSTGSIGSISIGPTAGIQGQVSGLVTGLANSDIIEIRGGLTGATGATLNYTVSVQLN